MKLSEKLFGISTENLYLAVLAKLSFRYEYDDAVKVEARPLTPLRYVLIRKENYYNVSKDIFTKTEYNIGTNGYKPGEITVILVEPIISNKNKITYKDALDILETKNTVKIM